MHCHDDMLRLKKNAFRNVWPQNAGCRKNCKQRI